MSLSIIAAIAEGGLIGRDGELPWRLPADLARFKEITMGNPLVMGRRTYQSIGRPLPGRRSIVVSRTETFRPDGVEVAKTFEEAVRLAGDANAFVIGGAQIYTLAIPLASKMYITRVHAKLQGDTYFPIYDEGKWRRISVEPRSADHRNEHAVTFEVYERRQ